MTTLGLSAVCLLVADPKLRGLAPDGDGGVATQPSRDQAVAGLGFGEILRDRQFYLIYFSSFGAAVLSFVAFVLSVIIVGIGAAVFHSKTKQHAIEMREAAKWENRLYDRLSDVLDGFKEVRLNRARSDALF